MEFLLGYNTMQSVENLCLYYSSTLKTEAICFYETLVDILQTTCISRITELFRTAAVRTSHPRTVGKFITQLIDVWSELRVTEYLSYRSHSISCRDNILSLRHRAQSGFVWIHLAQGSATCGSRATCGSLDVKLRLFSSIRKCYLFYKKNI
jgi:hypothetical protein